MFIVTCPQCEGITEVSGNLSVEEFDSIIKLESVPDKHIEDYSYLLCHACEQPVSVYMKVFMFR